MKILRYQVSFLLILLLFSNIYSLDLKAGAEEDYIKAIKYLAQKDQGNAVKYFEKAVFSDSRILGFDDKGLLEILTVEIIKRLNSSENPENLMKAGYIMRIRGEYEQSLSFYKMLSEKYSDNELYLNEAKKMIRELEFVIDSSSQKSEVSEDKKNGEKPEEDATKKAENKSDIVKEQAEKKEDTQQAIKKQKIADQQKLVDEFKSQYDLWFGLTYDKQQQEKKSYYSDLMYYYEKKMKDAQKELDKLSEK